MGSLFKARDYWQVQCGGEEFDGNCLCIANVDNDPNGEVKIITGSLQGNLRMYLPKERDYRPEDLLLEQELEQAILQIAAGRFSASGGIQLAILHPRKLVVYNVQSMGNQYLQLNKLYEHYMEHTAANMCYGPFGGVQGLDYICVQSYDGQLTFLECESHAFSRYLPGFLIPGPLAYIEQSDSFLTCSSAFELECYKYKSLAAASGEKLPEGQKQPGGLQVAKRVQADWRICLGESAIDIRCGRLSAGLQAYQADIVVLCEHTVFVVSSNGAITFQKRLEYHPACSTTYAVPGAKLPGGLENLLVASHNKSLLVYRGNVLCWSAKTDIQPVAVRVADLAGGALRGMIVMLSDDGTLAVSYLGTDPMLNPVGFGEAKALDYEAMSREQRALAAIIREHAGGRRAEPPDKLLMRTQVPAVFDGLRGDSGGDDYEEGIPSGSGRMGPTRKVTAKLYLAYQGSTGGADGVTITVTAPEPVSVDKDVITLSDVGTNPADPTVVPIVFRAGPPSPTTRLPSSCTATIVATYATASGEPRAQNIEVQLPMCLFASVVSPVKNAGYKVTIAINRPPPQLTAVFEDVIAVAPAATSQALVSGAAGGANVMSFSFPGGQDVTVVVSKNGGRYRLQSDTLEAMWLVLHELVRRLTTYYEQAEAGVGPSGGEGPLCVTFDEPLPLVDFFEVVDAHFNARLRIRELRKTLEDRAIQFRIIQKRLLMRFKDKNPAPLNQLDFLMEETYTGLMEAGTLMETAQGQLAVATVKLSCDVQLMLLLIKFKFGLSPAEASVMRSYLCPEVEDGEEVGWEEGIEASMTQLLRTALAKNAKEAAVSVPQLTPSRDTTRLKKHVSLVLERLAKGMRMALEPEDGGPVAGGGGGGGTMGLPGRGSASMGRQGSARPAVV